MVARPSANTAEFRLPLRRATTQLPCGACFSIQPSGYRPPPGSHPVAVTRPAFPLAALAWGAAPPVEKRGKPHCNRPRQDTRAFPGLGIYINQATGRFSGLAGSGPQFEGWRDPDPPRVQVNIPRQIVGRGSEVQGRNYRSLSSTTEAPPPSM